MCSRKAIHDVLTRKYATFVFMPPLARAGSVLQRNFLSISIIMPAGSIIAEHLHNYSWLHVLMATCRSTVQLVFYVAEETDQAKSCIAASNFRGTYISWNGL